jgi:hypothetical protein
MMQALGRRYAAAFNRRHGRTRRLVGGALPLGPDRAGEPTLLALRHVDARWRCRRRHGRRPLERSSPLRRTAAAPHRTGRRDAALVDPPEYWHLGNTPVRPRVALSRSCWPNRPVPADRAARCAAPCRAAWAYRIAGVPGRPGGRHRPTGAHHGPAAGRAGGATRLSRHAVRWRVNGHGVCVTASHINLSPINDRQRCGSIRFFKCSDPIYSALLTLLHCGRLAPSCVWPARRCP